MNGPHAKTMIADRKHPTRPGGRDERRSDPRRMARFHARLHHDEGVISGEVIDISFGGALFVTAATVPLLSVGELVGLAVISRAAPQSDVLDWSGEVVRVETVEEFEVTKIAYAVAFDEGMGRDTPGFEDATGPI